MSAEDRRLAGFEVEHSAGLFIGVREFSDPTISPVHYGADDAVDLAYLFCCELGLLDPFKVVVALAGEPQKPESQQRLVELQKLGARRDQPNLQQLYRLPFELGATTGERGLFVVSLASHGLADQGAAIVLPADAVGRRPVFTGLRFSALLDDVARSPAPRRLVFADCCRVRRQSGIRDVGEEPADREATLEAARKFCEELAGKQGLESLLGATHDGYSYDDHQARNGVFTRAVIEGLRGEAAVEGNELITLDDLAAYADRRVTAWIRNHQDQQHQNRSRGITLNVEPYEMRRLPLAPAPARKPNAAAQLRPRPPAVIWARQTGRDDWGEWADLPVTRSLDLRFRKVAAGEFLMGSPSTEPGRQEDEGPQHPAKIAQPFWLAEVPVTRAIWAGVMREIRFTQDYLCPSEVSWHEANEFLGQLTSSHREIVAVLPTEAQWEYACRAGQPAVYREEDLWPIAWYLANSGGRSQPVGLLERNAWGFFDLLGNVCEWCADPYRAYAASGVLQSDLSPEASGRVVRGGSFDDRAERVRAAARSALSPQTRYNFVGFRVALRA